VLFQAVTSMAPAGALALSISLGATYAGGALPLAVLLALVGCLLVAGSIGHLAKHLPSAGSIYTYPAAGIHPSIGFLVGWGYSPIEMLIGPTTMVLFGCLVSSVTQAEFHWPFTATWIIFMIAAALVVGGLNFRGIVVSAGTGTVLGALEILVFVVLFYVLGTYAGDVFFGPNRFDTFGALNGGSPWIQLARDAWGIGWVIAFLAIANSTFANGNAGTMATTRTWYAMRRVGVLPRALAATGSRLAIIEDASHLCFAEQPQEFNDLVNSFLARAGSPG
jgi:amino acid transporter